MSRSLYIRALTAHKSTYRVSRTSAMVGPTHVRKGTALLVRCTRKGRDKGRLESVCMHACLYPSLGTAIHSAAQT